MLGLSCLAFGAGFAYASAMDMIPKNGWIGWVFAAICGLIAMSCIPGKHVAVTGRVVGGFVFLLCAVYVVSEIRNPGPGGNRATPSLKNALALFALWGMPAGYVALRGVYPTTARLGNVFGKEPPDGNGVN
ncbi:hypothetical protein OP10G_2582 [Fimbriimonas ginsengisoli Gsoil 348]|uniref:Uncharacterized protein n=2 Tax=Fimbriimonas ginsengisoli TaxID=1005039 RepID=A0A068NT51_FIMGI|nr:hypothetical protein OP10G_2582 [Fimbriimonas ginsengisoli Gsoil 348]